MAKNVSIVMYHYVRDLKVSRYPEIKGLELSIFKKQLKYIIKNYKVISMEDLFAARAGKINLPARAALLTFDDGFSDHFSNVYPLLNRLEIQGSFFPSLKAIMERQLLDVHKIHFILEVAHDKEKMTKLVIDLINKSGVDGGYYFKKFAKKNRFDTKEVVFIKCVLQFVLPEIIRKKIISSLFQEYLDVEERILANELYLTGEQLKCMYRNGMYIGSHSYDHSWLDTLSVFEQEEETSKSLKILRGFGINTTEWAMSYPYGAYNDSLLSIIKKQGCVVGLSTAVGVADLNKNKILLLPRLDANDLPR